MSLEDYDIISILGDSISSASYKVRNKTTNKVLVWQTVDYSTASDSEKNKIVKKVQKRINVKHQNFISFYDYIDQKENKLLYVVVEYCVGGSLKKLISYCIENKIVMHEDFVCKILYQIVFALKTVEDYVGCLSVEDMFFDEEYNLKLYNYAFSGPKSKLKDMKMSVLGATMFEVCTLKKYEKNIVDSELRDLATLYSGSFVQLLMHMIKDSGDLKKNIDKILCHPTLLMRSSRWTKEKSFVKLTGEKVKLQKPCMNEYEDPDEIRMEVMRNKETALQLKEKKLMEKEQKLLNREKKLIMMEKTLTEKLKQADIYLKQCKQNTLKMEKENTRKLDYINLDSTYVDCGDSVILPTSKKIDANNIMKPTTFSRTFSERRIRFKGHSPLKEIDVNRRRTLKLPRKVEKKGSESSSDWKTCSENDSEISSLDGTNKNIFAQPKQLFVDAHCEPENEYEVPPDCRPIAWTEESKKYAFEMLRLMNGAGEKDNRINWDKEIRHTVL